MFCGAQEWLFSGAPAHPRSHHPGGHTVAPGRHWVWWASGLRAGRSLEPVAVGPERTGSWTPQDTVAEGGRKPKQDNPGRVESDAGDPGGTLEVAGFPPVS